MGWGYSLWERDVRSHRILSKHWNDDLDYADHRSPLPLISYGGSFLMMILFGLHPSERLDSSEDGALRHRAATMSSICRACAKRLLDCWAADTTAPPARFAPVVSDFDPFDLRAQSV